MINQMNGFRLWHHGDSVTFKLSSFPTLHRARQDPAAVSHSSSDGYLAGRSFVGHSQQVQSYVMLRHLIQCLVLETLRK